MAINTKLNVQTVSIDDIKPRDINANKMEESKFDFLVKYMEKTGYVQPIIVVDDGDGSYTIVDGEHRWRAAKENAASTLDVIIVDMDLREQDIMSINMNQIKGELQPDKFGEMLRRIVDGESDTAASELSSLIAMDQSEIDAYLKITEEVEASDYAKEDYVKPFFSYHFKVKTEECVDLDKCFDHIRARYPIKEDGDILLNLVSFYMRRQDEEDE